VHQISKSTPQARVLVNFELATAEAEMATGCMSQRDNP